MSTKLWNPTIPKLLEYSYQGGPWRQWALSWLYWWLLLHFLLVLHLNLISGIKVFLGASLAVVGLWLLLQFLPTRQPVLTPFRKKIAKKLILMPHDISVQVAKFEILIPLQVALQSGRYISNGDFQSKRAKNGVPNFFCSIMQPFYTEKFNRGWRREWTEGSTIDFNQ